MHFNRLALWFLLAGFCRLSSAQDTSCLAPLPEYNANTHLQGKEIQILADKSQVEQDRFLSFTGNVGIASQEGSIAAQRAKIDKSKSELIAEGEVTFANPQIRVESGSVLLNTDSGRLDLKNSQYRMVNFDGRGQAQRIFLDKQQGIQLREVNFTTCPIGSEDWVMQASSIELEPNQLWGKAKHTRFYVAGVPVFYLPYFVFPVTDERQSGLLVPELSTSSSTGVSFAQPYYWNLAPNYDMTITPRIMVNRGVQLNTLFRYLGKAQQGQMHFEYLANDKDLRPNRDRYFYRWNHRGKVFDDWLLSIDYNNISDDNYIVDLGSDYYSRADTHLYQTLGLNYYSQDLDISLQMRGFELVGDHPSSYRALPEAKVRYETQTYADIELKIDSELAYFDNALDERPNAFRWHLAPKIVLPYRRTWGEFLAEAGVLNTYYRQSNVEGTRLKEEVNRTLFQGRFFGTLHFERQTQWLSESLTQTLEPKIQYLYTSYTDQQDIGLYDTTRLLNNFGGLFRGQEFTGLDRISDNDQITIGLTSRIFDKNNREQFALSLGQIFYLSKNRVLAAAKANNRSALATELDWRISSKWFLRSQLQLSTQTDKVERSSVLFEYQYDTNRLLQFNHRYVRDLSGERINQLGITAAWPISENWRWVGRWYKDISRQRTIESYTGIQYDSCCWSIGLVSQRHLSNRYDTLGGQSTEEFDSSIKLLFSFRGLGTGGGKRKMLQDGLFGYRQPYSHY